MRCCATAVRELFCTSGCRGTLLPLGRRWPVVSKTRLRHDGPDEGAFKGGEGSRPSPVRPNDLRPRHERLFVVHQTHATVSHGLTSSPPEGERGLTSATLGCLNEC